MIHRSRALHQQNLKDDCSSGSCINWATSLSLFVVCVPLSRSLISIRKRWSRPACACLQHADFRRRGERNCHPFIVHYVQYVIHINRWWNKSVRRLIFLSASRPSLSSVFFLLPRRLPTFLLLIQNRGLLAWDRVAGLVPFAPTGPNL